MYPARAEYVAAREAADRPPKLTAIVVIRLTLPFLSRGVSERLNETLRAIKQLTNTNAQISPATKLATWRHCAVFPVLGKNQRLVSS
jgi:hypothetical protein